MFDYKRLLIDVRNALPPMVKNKEAFKYKYLEYDQIMEKALPVLEEHDFLLYHQVLGNRVRTVIVDLLNENAEYDSFIDMGNDLNPQEAGSAITYFKRYNVVALLNLVTEDDNDGARSSRPGNAEGATSTRNERRSRRRAA